MRRVLLIGVGLVAAVALGPVGQSHAQPSNGPHLVQMMGHGMMSGGMMGNSGGMMGNGMEGRGYAPPSQGRAAASGRSIFRQQCALCHSVTAGAPHGAGPDLYGLFGRRAGSEPGYPYSRAMAHARIVWSTRTLNRFLADPQSVVPGNRMPFPGIADRHVRQELIGYLKGATR